ncbi:MAG TPA: CpaF family protein [Candidatus Dormibacteraeota bacterium]
MIATDSASLAKYYPRLGPIGEFVARDDVTEVMVLGAGDIYIEVGGKIHLTGARFRDEDELLHLIRYIVESVGRKIDEQTPLCDARLRDGSRVHAAIRPVAVDGPMLTIRKFARTPLTVADLIALGSCTDTGFAFMEACVQARANILVSGGTGSGKTTLLNVLSGFIPDDERIVTIEDAAELQLRQRHVARLESRPASAEGTDHITIRHLVISSLRMRPDRLVVGEVRGPEALDMLQAMNTGHEGSMTTVHANRSRDALSRLETLVMMSGVELPSRPIRQQIASAFHIIVHLSRDTDGSRRVTQISEITGMEEDTITMQDIFSFRRTGSTPDGKSTGVFEPTGLRPRMLDRLAASGTGVPPALAHLFPLYR